MNEAAHNRTWDAIEETIRMWVSIDAGPPGQLETANIASLRGVAREVVAAMVEAASEHEEYPRPAAPKTPPPPAAPAQAPDSGLTGRPLTDEELLVSRQLRVVADALAEVTALDMDHARDEWQGILADAVRHLLNIQTVLKDAEKVQKLLTERKKLTARCKELNAELAELLP